MMRKFLLVIVLLSTSSAYTQTIQEKRMRLSGEAHTDQASAPQDVQEVNSEIQALKEQLLFLYEQARFLYELDAPEKDYSTLIQEIRYTRQQLAKVEQQWRNQATITQGEEPYALWHQPWSSVEQLILDYGSSDYAYVIPPEVGAIRLSVISQIPVPREAWDEMIELILAQNGIGIKQLNPFLRHLYLIHASAPEMAYVTSERTQLATLPAKARVCFVLSPPPASVSDTYTFLDRFVQPYDTTMRRIGQSIFLLSTPERVLELLKVYDFIEQGAIEREYRMITLTKIPAAEMKTLLQVYFDGTYEREPESIEYGGLRVFALEEVPGSLFIAGPTEAVREAEQMIADIEADVADPKQMTVFTYAVQHSEVEEVAGVLSQVYALMLANPTSIQDAEAIAEQLQQAKQTQSTIPTDCSPPTGTSPACNPNLPITTSPVGSSVAQRRNPGLPDTMGNFVVSPKTGTIIMVVQQDLLPQLKGLLRTIDVPKRMVRIEVLLCERRVTDSSKFGLDLLRLGSSAQGSNRLGFSIDGFGATKETGIATFLASYAKHSVVPAFDIIYNFLMSREDMRINASPSITTVNNTEAKIELVEEISIDNGTFIDPDFKDNILKRSFTRAQYGITIVITPTINLSADGNGTDYITLDTSVLFDTPRASKDNRPPVVRRRITNEVRIADGQTVVLGGLHAKIGEDIETGLPFLSEIPCFGKLFGSTKMTDRDTEMYIFITPKIVEDPSTEMRKLQHEFLCRRPGDLPEFLHHLQDAKDHQKTCLFERTLKTLFGHNTYRGYSR